MVEHLRRQLTEKYPATWQDELRQPFGVEWEKIRESSLRFEAAGALEAVAKDEFDYLGVNHFHAIVAKHYDVLFPADTRMPAIAKLEARTAMLRWLKQIKDLRDGIAHPVSEDFSALDALLAMSAAYHVLKRFDLPSAEAVQGLIAEAVLTPSVAGGQGDAVSKAVEREGADTPTPSAAVEAMFLRFEPAATYRALIEFFAQNAQALEEVMPAMATRHRQVARSLEELLERVREP